MALTNNNGQFGGQSGAAGNNFAGTDFVDAGFSGPATIGQGIDAANSQWIATIYSKKVLNFFRTASVVEGVTNNDYYGEISAYGDSVIIIKEPKVSIVDYGRGDTLDSQALDSDSFTLVLDQAKAFQFQVDDIEVKLSHVNWQALATNSATYSLKNDYDKSVLEYMAQQVANGKIIASAAGEVAIAAQAGAVAFATLAATGANVLVLKVGATEAEITAGTHQNPLDLLNKLNLKLDLEEVPEEARWVVVDPEFVELLMRQDSAVLNRDLNGGMKDLKAGLGKNGLMSMSPIRGLMLHKTINAPKLVTAARPQTDAKLQDAGRIILAGHISAVATASAIVKTEVIRSTATFADIVRGLHVYGRGVVRPESLVAAAVTYKEVLA